MVNIKISKHCGNLLKVSNEIKQYVKSTIVKSHQGCYRAKLYNILDLINDIEQVFPRGTAIK